MNLDRYAFKEGSKSTLFEFVSVGKHGRIVKEVKFQQKDSPTIYNLAMGDKNPVTGKINYSVVTDNGDTEKVLVTVMAIVFAFTEKAPQAIVSATGTTEARIRLYRMYINKHLHIAGENFNVLGLCETGWESYERLCRVCG